jgi:tetratricopeptide (TPR) repeat protein/KaiC/GvpD/RAD55 family RecA-like ATPase
MKLLREASDRAMRGEGGIIFVWGEAGIGKTRLARELGGYARSRGMRVLTGRCPALFRMDGVPPYVLWEEVIKDYLATCTPEQLSRVVGSYPVEVSKLVPELKHKLRTFPQTFPLSPERSRDRLFEAVTQFVTNISREAPLLVILDDLQWTDQASLLLMHYLARGIYKEPLLLLGAYRDTYVDKAHPLSPVLAELNRERLLQSVQLKRLSLTHSSEMIGRVLEQERVPREFCRLVYERTGGNPFFIEEVIKSLKEEDLICREKNAWKIRAVKEIRFPETVKDVIRARISRLDEASQNVLTFASFVGKDFTFEALRGVSGVEEPRLVEILERMLQTGLVKETVVRGEDTYSFADIIVRDVVHDGVSRLKRKRLHRVVGDALEKVYAKQLDEHLGELALHFLESGDKEKALHYFLEAGEKAQQVYAHDEAFSYLHHGLELLEKKEGEAKELAPVAERLGDIKAWSGEVRTALKYWEQSLKLWDQMGESMKVAEIHAKMALQLWSQAGEKERASKHHQKALEILEGAPESVQLANLYEDIAHMLWRTGDSAKARPWAEKAFKMAESVGDPKALAGAYANLGILSGLAGDLEKSHADFERGLKVALESNCIEQASRLYNNLANAYYFKGEFQKLFQTSKEGTALAKKVGDMSGLPWIQLMLGGCYWNMGDVERAISLAEEGIALDKRTRSNTNLSYMLWALGAMYGYLGEWDRSLQLLLEARDISNRLGEWQSSASTALSLGELFMEMENYDEAERYFKEGDGVYEKAGAPVGRFTDAFPALTRLYLKTGRLDEAKKRSRETYEHVAQTQVQPNINNAELVMAMVFREEKNWEQASQHFEKSLQGFKSLNAGKWLKPAFADMLYEYGLFFLERGEAEDKEKAASFLGQALRIYEELGAQKRIQRVQAQMSRLGPPQREALDQKPAIAPPEPLAPRRVATGSPHLDGMLSGGIPVGYAVILTSPSFDERDLLVRKFIETGVKNGQATFYVTCGRASGMVGLAARYSHFSLFVCNPQADKIVDDRPNVFKTRGVDNLNALNIALTSALRGLAAPGSTLRRCCIELVSDVLLEHQALQTRRWLTGLLPELKAQGFTVLAVMDPEMHSVQEARAIIDVFDGEINIFERETETGSQKLLRIRKMQDQKYSKKELPLNGA